MAVTLDGSSPAAVYSDADLVNSIATAAFTPPSGSIVLAKVTTADSSCPIITPTGLTFTSRVNTAPANNCNVALFTAVGGGASVTVTANFSGTIGHARSLVVEVWTSAQLAATPAVHNVSGSGAPSDTITTVAANSVVAWVNADWAAVAGARTYRDSPTEDAYHTLTNQWTVESAYQAAASAGSQTYGMTAPTGQTFNMAAIEIQATGGTPIPPSLIMQTRRAY